MMIPFLRKIRRNSLKTKKFSQYLLYAIGEIVLVIFGILIALNINNYNEKAKNEEKINVILKKIQRELAQSIKEANSLLEFYAEKDSLIYLVLNNKVSKEDYENSFDLSYLISNYSSMTINDNSFQSLMQYAEYIPEKFTPIVDNLQDIYGVTKNSIDNDSDGIENLIDQLTEYQQYNHKSWFSDKYFKFKIPEESINYYLTDAVYKNHVIRYSTLVMQGIVPRVMNFIENATKIYREIDDELDNPNESVSPFKTVSEFNHFVGKYKASSKRENALEVEIIIEEERIYYLTNFSSKKVEIFPFSKNHFFREESGNFHSLILNEKEEVTSFIMSRMNFRYELEKVE